MKKPEAVSLLVHEGWTKEDAKRALESIDFALDPDELTIRRATSKFSGVTLIERQRLQAAQKALVTKLNKKLEELKIKFISAPLDETSTEKINSLIDEKNRLINKLEALIKTNEELKKDNKNLKNILDAIKLKLAIDTKKLLEYEDSEIRKALIKLFHSTLG